MLGLKTVLKDTIHFMRACVSANFFVEVQNVIAGVILHHRKDTHVDGRYCQNKYWRAIKLATAILIYLEGRSRSQV